MTSLIDEKVKQECQVELRALNRTVGGRVKAEIYVEGIDYLEIQWPGSTGAQSKFVDLDED